MRLCRDCLKAYRHRNKGATKPWPFSLYHSGTGRNCPTHAAIKASYSAVSSAKRSKRAPDWADKAAIRKIYKEAAERRINGEDVHVDHVIPLLGKLVSGLHVAENLAIIPAKDNIRKGNKFTPEAS